MVTRFFLGANTGGGFYSLYDGFASREGDFLWMLKGGPGGGKSGFMKRIGALAEGTGLDVEYIYCSGDPASLDGVYVPALRTGWVDATAPHAMDPKIFGVTGAYIDLGAYCGVSELRGERAELRDVTERYREKYSAAYALLRAASSLTPENIPELVTDAERSAVIKRAKSAAGRELPKATGNPGGVTMRFIEANTCKGSVLLRGTVSTLCKRIYLLDNALGLGGAYLDVIAAEAKARGVDAVLCPDPLAPDTLSAVLLPALSLGFLTSFGETELDADSCRHVRLDAIVDAKRIRPLRPRLRRCARMWEELISAACAELWEAKALHDKLEGVFNPHVRFAGIYELARESFRRAAEGGIIYR